VSCISPLDKRFNLYLTELLKWNEKFNLTAITDPVEIELKHFADSLALLDIFKLTTESVIDLGTGAGFPGLPLKLVCPKIKLTLVEATGKKCQFLKQLVDLCKLTEVEIINGRAEEVVKERREQFDLAVARAVAEMRVLAEYALPFVKVGGTFVAYKEAAVEAEVAAAANAIKELGGRNVEIKKVALPNSTLLRSLVVVAKTTPTPLKYPRRVGLAAKRPL